jgi:hypothetical protein
LVPSQPISPSSAAKGARRRHQGLTPSAAELATGHQPRGAVEESCGFKVLVKVNMMDTYHILVGGLEHFFILPYIGNNDAN